MADAVTNDQELLHRALERSLLPGVRSTWNSKKVGVWSEALCQYGEGPNIYAANQNLHNSVLADYDFLLHFVAENKLGPTLVSVWNHMQEFIEQERTQSVSA